MEEKELNELRECLQLLQAVESIEYHNKNWLPVWAIKSPKQLCEEKMRLIERALKITGTSSYPIMFNG